MIRMHPGMTGRIFREPNAYGRYFAEMTNGCARNITPYMLSDNETSNTVAHYVATGALQFVRYVQITIKEDEW